MDNNDFGDILSSAPDALEGEGTDQAIAPGYYFRLHGEQFGPVEVQELQGLINTGTLTARDRIRRDGSAAWIPCNEIETLNFPAGAEESADFALGRDTSAFKQQDTVDLDLSDLESNAAEVSDADGADFSYQQEVSIQPGTVEENPEPVGAMSTAANAADWWEALASPMPAKREHRVRPPADIEPNVSLSASTISTPSPTGPQVPEGKQTKKAAARPKRQREPLKFQIPSSPLFYVLAGLVIVFAAACFWPDSAVVRGSVNMDGTPVPLGSITLKPQDEKTVTINIVEGQFQASDSVKPVSGPCEIIVVIGDAFGSPIPAVNNSPAFANLSGAKYAAVIETHAGSDINVKFSSGDLEVIAASDGMPTESF